MEHGGNNGMQSIAQERVEQEFLHGITVAEDAKRWPNGELKKAALVLLDPEHTDAQDWPLDAKWYNKIINKSWRERLAIAGSFIAAEIDRLDYEERKATGWA